MSRSTVRITMLRVDGPGGHDELVGLVDTGADDTLIPDYLVKMTGLAVIPGEMGTTGGIDGGGILFRYARVNF